MATPRVEISLEELEKLAGEYIDECIESTKEVPTAKGAVSVKERHLPTISFFLRIWLPTKGKPTMVRSTYYDWLNQDNTEKSNTIKKIDELFKSLAEDIVANEGKGIFYAKNRLGMTDKMQSNETVVNVEVSPEEAKKIADSIFKDI